MHQFEEKLELVLYGWMVYLYLKNKYRGVSTSETVVQMNSSSTPGYGADPIEDREIRQILKGGSKM